MYVFPVTGFLRPKLRQQSFCVLLLQTPDPKWWINNEKKQTPSPSYWGRGSPSLRYKVKRPITLNDVDTNTTNLIYMYVHTCIHKRLETPFRKLDKKKTYFHPFLCTFTFSEYMNQRSVLQYMFWKSLYM